jgi:hypothetical protein
MLKINITDVRNKNTAYVDSADGQEAQALVVATRDLKTYNYKLVEFTNSTYGTDMNINAAYGGTPILIYDENVGTPVEWNVAALSGTWVLNNVAQAYNGTMSVSNLATGPGEANATVNFSKGSNQSLTGYTSITGWIYLTTVPTGNINFGGYLAGVLVGSLVDIRNYVNASTTGVWQNFAIPLIAMNLTAQTIDSFRLTKVNRATTFYVDYIRVQETGGGITFKIEPVEGTWLHVSRVRWTMVDAMAGTLASGTMPALAYNKLLNVTQLPTGINGAVTINGSIVYTTIVRNLIDILTKHIASIVDYGSDGTNTWIVVDINPDPPIILKAEFNDSISYTLTDDLTGLIMFKISASGKEEVRTNG